MILSEFGKLAEGMAAARQYAKRTGGSMRFLEADWVATSKTLYYISPRPGAVYRWGWEEIESITPGKRGLFTPNQFERLVVRTRSPRQTSFDLRLRRTASMNLVAIYAALTTQ